MLQRVLLDLGPVWSDESADFRKRFSGEKISVEPYTGRPVFRKNVFKKGDLVLTDCTERGEELSRLGIPFFGCSKEKAWFNGAVLVLQSLDGIDKRYLEEWYARAMGQPASITRTKRLVIREISRGDIDDLIRISRQTADAEGFTEEGLLSYIKTAYRLQGYGLWSVLFQGKVIGCCGFAPADGEDPETGTDKGTDSVLEMQYMIDSDSQRAEFGTEMCRAAMGYAYDRLEAAEILVRIRKDNAASLALAKKLGFSTFRVSGDEILAISYGSCYNRTRHAEDS